MSKATEADLVITLLIAALVTQMGSAKVLEMKSKEHEDETRAKLNEIREASSHEFCFDEETEKIIPAHPSETCCLKDDVWVTCPEDKSTCCQMQKEDKAEGKTFWHCVSDKTKKCPNQKKLDRKRTMLTNAKDRVHMLKHQCGVLLAELGVEDWTPTE